MSVRKYIKRPTVVEAVLWNGANLTEVLTFCNGKAVHEGGTISLHTPVGRISVGTGKYLVKGIDDDIYPSDADIFLKKYEPID